MDLNPIFENFTANDIAAKTPEGKDVALREHDTDTMYDAQGQGYRIPGINAAEVPKLTSVGGFSAGSPLGIAQTQASKQIIKDYGFNQLVDTGKKDIFNRSIMDLSNNSGENYGSFLIRNRIVAPDINTSDRDMIARSTQIAADFMNSQQPKTPVQKAREIVDSVISKGQTIVLPQANTIEEYQDYAGATSNKGLGVQEERIKALEKRLESPKLLPEQKLKVQDELMKARDVYQYNLNMPKNLYMNSIEGVNSKRSTGTLGEWGRAIDIGWLNVKDSAANILQWTGDALNNKELEQKGKDMNYDINRAKRLVDIRVGDKDITGGTVTTLDDVKNDFSKLFRFIGTTTLLYGPQMGVMIAGSAAGGLVGSVAGPAGTAIGANIVPMMMGIGDVYGEMPEDEKNPTTAAALGSVIGIVDRIGFSKGSAKSIDLLTKEGVEKTITKLATVKGISEIEAKELLHKSVLELGKDYATVVKTVATNHLKSKENLSDLLLNITKHSGKEAATEALQEAIQYVGIRQTTSMDFDYNELYNRVRDAAIVGGLLGAEFSVPGAIADRANFNMNINMMQGIETKPLIRNSIMEQEEIKRNKGKIDDRMLAAKLRLSGGVKALSDLFLPGSQPKSIASNLSDMITNGGLFRQTRDNSLEEYIKYEGGRELAGLFDASSVRGVYGGMSAFKRFHAVANSALAMLPSNADKQALFGTTDSKEIGNQVLQSIANGTTTPAVDKYRNQLNMVAANLASTIHELGPSLGVQGLNTSKLINELSQPDYFLTNQLVNPTLVAANKQEFIDTLVNNYSAGNMGGKLSPTFANDLADRIINGISLKEMKDLNDIGMLNNPVLTKFRSNDLERNTVKLVEMIARSTVKENIFGNNGEVAGAAIKKMLDSGELTAEQASELAHKVNELLQAFDGQLHKPQSELMKGVNDNLTFVTMLIYMDTSLFANLAEAMYGALGLSPKQMVKYFGLLAKEFASDVVAKLTQVGSIATKGAIRARDEQELSKNISILQQTGHHGKINDIAFNVGANIQTQSKANLSKLMFKFNLVESATNAVRAARGAIACDEITHLVSIIAESPNNNDVTRWARDRLSYYRMDPDALVNIYNKVGSISVGALTKMSPSDPLFNELADQLSYGITNFIDEFSSRPEPGSTAKVFDDQRFALFTQFKKFTWHFTTNVIPQLWNMYLKRGKPEYTYSSFALMASAFAAAYAGLYLKSMLRGEDEEKDDEKKFMKRMKQSFDYSLGQAYSDVYTTVSNATEERADGSLKNSPFKTVLSQSPSLNLLFNSGKDVYNIATEEDSDKSKSNLIRRIPVFGEIPSIRNVYEKEK